MSGQEWLEERQIGVVPDEIETLFEAMGFQWLGTVRWTAADSSIVRFAVFGAGGEATWAEVNFADGFDELGFTTELDDGRAVITLLARGESLEPRGRVEVFACEPQSIESLWAAHRSNVERVGRGARPRVMNASRDGLLAIYALRWKRLDELEAAMARWSLIVGAGSLLLIFVLYRAALEVLFVASERYALTWRAYVGIAMAAALGLIVAAFFALGGWASRRLRAWLLRRLADAPEPSSTAIQLPR